MQGWIKLHRKLMESSSWLQSTVEQKVILITLLLMANHAANNWEWKGKPFTCKAGQFVTSAKSIQECCGLGVSRQNIRTALRRLKTLDFLTIESTNTNSLITICNWETYQLSDSEANQPSNQHLTSSQPTPNQPLTTNKNVKKDKNEKKTTYMDFVLLTSKEHSKLIERFGKSGTAERIAALNEGIGSKGYKYKSHYFTILSWERKNGRKAIPQNQRKDPEQQSTGALGDDFGDQESEYGTEVKV